MQDAEDQGTYIIFHLISRRGLHANAEVKCSPGDPCNPCMASAVKGSERKVLSFCYCIRARFSEVDIFKHGMCSLMPCTVVDAV